MPKYFNEEGDEVELLSQEDVDAKIEEVKTELTTKFETEKTESDKKIGVLESEVTTAKDALTAAEKEKTGGGANGAEGTGGDDKDKNLGELRKKVEEADIALEEEKKTNAERWSKQADEDRDTMFDKLAGEDEELKKKIEFNFASTLSGVKATTAKEIQEKVAMAYKLATGKEVEQNPLDAALQGGTPGYNANTGTPAAGSTEFTSNDVGMGNKMGISDKDRETYGKDPRMNE